MIDLDELERRKKAATPGPWRACRDGECSCGMVWAVPEDVLVMSSYHDEDVPCVRGPTCGANAALTVSLVNGSDELIASTRTLRALRAECDHHLTAIGKLRAAMATGRDKNGEKIVVNGVMAVSCIEYHHRRIGEIMERLLAQAVGTPK